MSWSRDFAELADKLDELSDVFEQRSGQPRDPDTGRFRSKEGRFDPKRRIAAGVDRAMTKSGGIIDQAKAGASGNVTRDAQQSIQYNQIAWNRHEMFATHELVKYHEYGTSTKADDKAQATINAPNGDGYVIPLDGYSSLPFGPKQVEAMDELNFQFVVHPGVEGKHFMRDALLGNTWMIEDEVANELDNISIDI